MAVFQTAGVPISPTVAALFGNNTQDPSTEVARVLQMVVTTLIFLVGIPLNGLVVWVLGVRSLRRGGKRSSGSFGMYVVNLALADLLLVLRTPLALGYLAANYHWPFGLPTCRLVMVLRVLGLYSNAFLLCAISVERCLCLLHPLWYRLQRPPWVVPLVCGILWMVSILLSLPYFFTSIIIPYNNHSQCMENTPQNPSKGLFITETLLGFLLPLFIFVTCNLAVLLTAWKTGGTMSPTPTSPRYTKLYRVLFFTMLVFLTCWVPYFTFRFLKTLYGDDTHHPFYISLRKGVFVSLYLVYIKSALNPVLYVFVGKGLGHTIKASLLSAIDRVFNDETSDYSRRKSLRERNSLV
nr:PREDICTED: C3a anaphylatoxin chemotactic receptor-like [Lepisosteus oculatus]